MAKIRDNCTVRVNVKTRRSLKQSVEYLVRNKVRNCSVLAEERLCESILLLISLAENND
jgi:hypothetical protein